MALPSQSSGTPSRFSQARPRRWKGRRKSPAKLIVISVLVVAAIGSWWVIFGNKDDNPTVPNRAGAQTAADRDKPLSRTNVPMPPPDSRVAGNTTQKNAAGTKTSGSTKQDNTGRSLLGSSPNVESDPTNTTNTLAANPNQASLNSAPGTNPNTSAVDTSLQGSPAQGEVAQMIESGRSMWQANKPIEARDVVNRALHHARALPDQQQQARALLTEISELVTFSPRVIANDPMAMTYEIQSGDALARIARSQDTKADWRLIMRINKIQDDRRIYVGQKLKLLRGPFHVVVIKNDYRVDLYSDKRDSAGNRIYLRSFSCGLGEYDSTPIGEWVVRENSKLVNPHWVNPRTRERFDANDPKNPIGEYWIGIRGTDPDTQVMEGYGLHGTIEPDSIGQQMSMGCVRLLPGEIDLLFEMLSEGESSVIIMP